MNVAPDTVPLLVDEREARVEEAETEVLRRGGVPLSVALLLNAIADTGATD